MRTDSVLHELADHTAYSRKDLFQLLLQEKPDMTESAFRWTLYNMQQNQELYRVDYDAYMTGKPETLPKYHPLYTDKAKDVMNRICGRFPELNFVVLESVLLNEFLNHQIAQNTIYVQIEKDVSSYITDILQNEYGGIILHKPSKKEFDRYWMRDCIIVLDLISQSPLDTESPHEITAEKMMVDIVAEKSIEATFSPSELPFIFDNVISNYRIDMRRLNRYAGRRGKTEEIKKYMER